MTLAIPFERRIERQPSGCWLWTGPLWMDGYGRYRNRRAHRVAYERAIGAIPAGFLVMHSCDNPPCVNPAHLKLGTTAENTLDMVAKGRAIKASGEHNGQAKLTAAQAAEIRRLHKVVPQRKLAAMFGVSVNTIYKIHAGITWHTTGSFEAEDHERADAVWLRRFADDWPGLHSKRTRLREIADRIEAALRSRHTMEGSGNE